MHRLPAALLVIAASIALATPGLTAALAFTHVNVIDVTGGPVQRDMTVVSDETHIVAIGRSDVLTPPPGARIVAAQGKYLIPGLWDMHVHTVFGDWLPRNERVTLPLFVANGVTGVRDMGGDLPVLKEWRAAIAAGQLLGPRMFIAGPMLDGPVPRFPSSAPVATAADGRRIVDELQAQGVDFIKIQSLVPRDGYFAAADEARKLGISFVGHVPDAVRAAEASNAGQKSIEHFTGILGQWAMDNKSWDKADPVMADLFRWHLAEEVEHRTVAFDLFQHLCQTELGFYVSRQALMVVIFPLFVYALTEAGRSLARQDKDRYSRWMARQNIARLLLELERVGRRTENVPTFSFLLAATVRWLSPRFHPVSEGNTEQALAYLARSPAARAATAH